MKATFRTWLSDLEAAGELRRVREAVDARYISATMAEPGPAVLLERVAGFDVPHVGGLLKTRRQVALGLGVPEREFAQHILRGVENPIPPRIVADSPVREVVQTGTDVDLTTLPIPLLHTRDGGPYLTSGVVVARTPTGTRNAGMYRLMYRSPRETSIDLASHSDLRMLARQAHAAGRPLPIAVAIGVHLNDMMAAGYPLPQGQDELAMAGGLHGEPVELVRGVTVDVEVPAESEIVLEGEIVPVGWTRDEGRFGDAYWVMGDVKWNPVVRLTAITRRRDAMLYSMHMPWENVWLGRPAVEAMAWKALRDARIDVRAVRAGFSSIVAAIHKSAGEGKNALLALLALGAVKLAIVTDDDIDIYDPEELDWAVALRVQADRDLVVVAGARGKHLDPSTRAWELAKGELPTTGKLGIDATVPERIPAEKYEHQQYPFRGQPRGAAVTRGEAGARVVDAIRARLRAGPAFFLDVVEALPGADYREILRAWGRLREADGVERDAEGRYLLP
jgi:2,5-furandicarboxylate decarboxylase 1